MSMKQVNIKTTHKAVKTYFAEIKRLTTQHQLFNEGQVAPPFRTLLQHYANELDYSIANEYPLKVAGTNIRLDGAVLTPFSQLQGVWEAKDSNDDLETEIKRKFARGYPNDNILFQEPNRAVLYRKGNRYLEADLTKPDELVDVVREFLQYRPPIVEDWEKAVEQFKDRVPQLADGVKDLIEHERQTNKKFIAAFQGFTDLVQQAINPDISPAAVEEMLIQHLLTERIFRKVFNNPDFARRNIIAREIETVIDAMTWGYRSRADFMAELDPFYDAIERAARHKEEYNDKQDFLNTVYERFFQGFAVKKADTHGIVYTPQPIVDFMVRSVEDILQSEFGRSLADEGVHVLDPFVGTGNFMLRVMHQIAESSRMQLPHKYAHDLHCNEVMLLPYYIASMNIENAYYELAGRYEPFNGIVLVDTFELTEGKQSSFSFMNKENTERAEKQMQQDLTVIIGNPPYNTGQINENDNNKNRTYKREDKTGIDDRVAATYAKDSRATNKNALSDVYVKAIRWASDRIGESGIVAFVTNNSFISALSFDGMRKHLAKDFSAVYHINMKGNARTSGKRRQQEAGNVFGDLIRVSVGITFFVRKKDNDGPATIRIYSVDNYLRAKEKAQILVDAGSYTGLELKQIVPNKRHTWLTAGLQADFEDLLPMGTKDAKRGDGHAIFEVYSNGLKSNNDAYVFQFNREQLTTTARGMVENYEAERMRWLAAGTPKDTNKFVKVDESVLKWIRRTKRSLGRGLTAEFDETQIRTAIYRPFTKTHHFFHPIFSEEVYWMPQLFPTPAQEAENRVICPGGYGRKDFAVFMTQHIPDLNFYADPAQCFPFYVYDEDGSNRRENITDWALQEFRDEYNDDTITKWDIFYYIYAVLHHPAYREKYKDNLKQQLPRIPFAPGFRAFAEAGQKLAELHVNYEEQPEYPLERVENKDARMTLYVEKMKLSKDKTTLEYNDFLTLTGIPPEAHEYKLGNRSALDWIIDRYRVKTDKRSGITNDPNQYSADDGYIVKLIGKVVQVSVETVRLVAALPPLDG